MLDIMVEEKCSLQFQKCLRIILTLFHGNASAEKSFSYKKHFLVENLQEDSLIAQRNVYNAVHSAGGVAQIEIMKDMMKSFRDAHKNKQVALKDKEKMAMKLMMDKIDAEKN